MPTSLLAPFLCLSITLGALELWYTQPAQRWVEALPIGNGRLGAMVFGGVDEERIQLNEDTMWAGPPVPENRENMAGDLAEARRLFFEGRPVEGERLVQERIMAPRISPRSHQTAGDLRLRLLHAGRDPDDPATSTPDGYRRALSLDTAIATTTYVIGGVRYERQVFASPVDDLIVVRLEASEPGSISLDVALDRPGEARPWISDNTLIIRGRVSQGERHMGVRFQVTTRVLHDGGSRRVADTTLEVRDADRVTILLAVATDYDFADPSTPRPGRELPRSSGSAIGPAIVKGFERIRRDHVAEHGRLFHRVGLDLGPSPHPDRPTDARLQAVVEGGTDPDLERLYFQYGRYLLMSSSRPGTMPANLQGLWNDHVEAPWNADYHVNINLQMNYWPAEVTNLSECHGPLFDLMEGMVADGRDLARRFGCAGIAFGHTTDAWMWSALQGRVVWGMWPLGAGWLSSHMMEHYRFTGDRVFLRERAYPFLREASAFFLDWLVEDPRTGRLVSGPTTSPENTYRWGEHRLSLSMGTSHDQQIIWETLTNTLEAADVLDIADEFTQRVRGARDRLASPRIGADGRLLEWGGEYEDAEPGHRHVSHLYGLHPGVQISPLRTPELAAAARRTLEKRLEHGGGHTGWSRAWLVNIAARLHDGDVAHEHLRQLLAKSTLPNLFDTHPPFQIDGNFGGCAGIAEMLLQSHLGELHLLPALPSAWPDGSVRGLCGRNGFVVDIEWRGGALHEARIRSPLGRTTTVRLGERTLRLDTERGETYTLTASDFR